ncbi:MULTISPECIES: PhzF family phenazine biosynthesis protein [unclassified Bosea (in: a-proteobacteria)]|uniref:PhzF family phenazine biosynthesis protein n=2 Tax=Bosea TaxID=85413 RepID=UPI000F75E27D|nr:MULTISPECIES: PhzF family phenazine biosynthesis protein [unclassified Bosea (in: a-proteobacteria)]AZO76735.1 phenazine biosynthesis protein PhzF [Bosea sp. Tri-49]RXT21568.1 phenazine biosynthesis protein PhzF [Bosea sp. Tri-39]RXT31907.1 phenazine biosynthesis protein PhzF [Bosea sp. Tri-54]
MTSAHIPVRHAGQVFMVNVFSNGPGGGNPAPIVVDARQLDGKAMRAVAAQHGHESAFVLPGPDGSDYRFRFFVPNHEMEMCGHATLGAVWLLDHLGELPGRTVSIATLSGPVQARVDGGQASVSQPRGKSAALDDAGAVLDVLGLRPSHLLDYPVVNAATSRIKTLVPLHSIEILNGLRPDFAQIEALCDAIGSTGLYPFAPVDADAGVFSARQFPRSSGYPEDAATGIAAAALAWSTWDLGLTSKPRVIVRQGEAMGRPSQITVEREGDRCWLSGRAELMGETPL